jgi:hypothetical protein
MLQFLFYGVIAALLVLAAIEIHLRIKYRNLLWIQVYPQVYVPDDELGYRYLPNAEGEIRIPGIHRRFRTNNRGFHARDFVRTKTPGTCRIAVVGPSNATGIWCHGKGKNFSELLEDLCRAAGHQVEIMNFGIDGRFRSVQELRLIETEVAEYKPDRILLDVELPFVHGSFRRDVYKGYVIIYNSETEHSRQWCQAMIDSAREQKFLIPLYHASFIVRAAVRYYTNRSNSFRSARLRAFVENRVQAPDLSLLPYSLKKSVESLQAVRDKLVEQGGELTILQCSANSYYREVTAKYGLSYLELDVLPITRYVHDRDGHYNYEGHVEVARQLFEQLTKRQAFQAKGQEPVAASDLNGAQAEDQPVPAAAYVS